jgi:hypothetical protein
MTPIALAIINVLNIKHHSYDLETKLTLTSKPRSTSMHSLSQLTQVQTPCREPPTINNTTELASSVSERSSPITPHPGFAVNASIM